MTGVTASNYPTGYAREVFSQIPIDFSAALGIL